MAQVTTTGNGYILYINANVTSQTPASNFSTVTYSMELRADSSPSGFSGFSPDTSNTYIVLNGVTYNCTPGQRTVNRGQTVTFFSGSVNISHNATTGVGSWSFSGRLLMQNPFPGLSFMPPDMQTGTGTVTATQFSGPSTPAAPTCTASGKNVTIVSGAASANTLAITKYDYRWSTDNVNFTTVSPLNTSTPTSTTSVPVFAATGGLTHYFQTRAVSTTAYAWGTGGWSASTSIFVSSGGRRWDGSTWTPTAIAKRWDGSSWTDLTIAKRWDGSSWADLS
jgi:hypothetical protein